MNLRQITIHRGGENYGPYPVEQARELLASSTLQETDLAYYEGAADWAPLKDIPGVHDSGNAPSDIPPVLSDNPLVLDNSSSSSEQSGPSTFPCPGCGADLIFSSGAAKMKCPYCGAEADCPTPKGLVLEMDFESQLSSLESGAATTTVTEVNCEACAATNQLEANATSGECAFCGTPFVQQPKSANVILPQVVLPFSVTKEDAISTFRSWIDGLWFAPSKLKNNARDIEKLKGLYLPHWTYDAHTITDYTGERGEYYYETEYYEDSSGNEQSREVQRTSWHYAPPGRVSVDFDDVLIPASDTLPRKYVDELEPWALESLTPYSDEYLSGFQSESYTTDLRGGFNIAKDKMVPKINSTIGSDIGGDTYRISSKQSYYQNISFKYILLPVWISAYRYKEKIYQFLINARTGELQGERPWDFTKVILIVLAILGTILILSILSVVFGVLAEHFGWI